MAEKQETKPELKMPVVKFAIEIDNHRNQSVQWYPDGRQLRGRWENARIPRGNQIGYDMRDMPDIPGIVIEVDTVKRTIRRYDPLRLERHKDLLAKIQDVHKRYWNENVGPEVTFKAEKASDDELKTWIYWARRVLDCENCVVRVGSVPTMDDIWYKIPGLVLKSREEGAIVDKMVDPSLYFGRKLRYMPPQPDEKPMELDTESVIDESEVLV